MVLEKLLSKMVINIKANFIMDFCMEKASLPGPMVFNMKDNFLTIESQDMAFIDGLMEAFMKEMLKMV